MVKKIIGIALILSAFVVEFFWLGLTFGSIIVGLILLIFAPGILLAPFHILLALGLGFYHHDRIAAAGKGRKRGDYFRHEEFRYDPREWHPGDLNRHYSTLGCRPGDDLETVKRAYRHLSREHHPDTVAARGGDLAAVEKAKELMQRINEAYRTIRESLQAERREYFTAPAGSGAA